MMATSSYQAILNPEQDTALSKVTERVSRIAPFITLDPDPYIVVSEGRLFWIIDGYTYFHRLSLVRSLSGEFQLYSQFRVKITVDATMERVRFYVKRS